MFHYLFSSVSDRRCCDVVNKARTFIWRKWLLKLKVTWTDILRFVPETCSPKGSHSSKVTFISQKTESNLSVYRVSIQIGNGLAYPYELGLVFFFQEFHVRILIFSLWNSTIQTSFVKLGSHFSRSIHDSSLYFNAVTSSTGFLTHRNGQFLFPDADSGFSAASSLEVELHKSCFTVIHPICMRFRRAIRVCPEVCFFPFHIHICKISIFHLQLLSFCVLLLVL